MFFLIPLLVVAGITFGGAAVSVAQDSATPAATAPANAHPPPAAAPRR